MTDDKYKQRGPPVKLPSSFIHAHAPITSLNFDK